MARKPRIEFAGALYHIIARGNNKEDIFRESKDYLKYMYLLEKYQKRTSFHLYAFALMTNHIHLLLETGDTPLSKIMQGIQQSYTQYFNRRYNRVGHLFQGRYKAILCEKDPYLLELIRYIHLNPVRSKMVDCPSKYPWSSHPVYLDKKRIKFIETDKMLLMFSKNKSKARELYLKFIFEEKDARHKEEFYNLSEQQCLGREEFIEEIKKRTKTTQEFEKKSSLIKLVKVIADLTKIAEESIKSSNRESKVVEARNLFIFISVRQLGYGCAEVARFLKKDTSSITRALNRMEKKLAKDRALVYKVDKIVSQI
ncbi:MAG TPA: hypothetical protein ENN38_00880 [Actinobacteria bacterium]|nr:hypothetical protein [Actinomycetota bacterium]